MTVSTHLIGQVRMKALRAAAVRRVRLTGETHVARVIEHDIGPGTSDQHVGAHVELAAVQQQRVGDVPDEKNASTCSENTDGQRDGQTAHEQADR